MNQEKQQGLIVGAITFVLVVIFFIKIGSETSTSTVATSPQPTINNQNLSGLLMAVTFTLTLLGLIVFNHFREKIQPASQILNAIKEDDSSLHYQLAQTRRDLQNSQREYQNAMGTLKQCQEVLLNLFGTTDFTQITSAVQALYRELSELRGQQESLLDKASLKKQLSRQQELTARLANERNQATALLQSIGETLVVDETASLLKAVTELARQAQNSQNWQEKAQQALTQVAELQQKMSEVNRWQELSEEDLIDFFKTVTLDNEAYLSSKRRQRRLLQRFRAEKIHLYRRTNPP